MDDQVEEDVSPEMKTSMMENEMKRLKEEVGEIKNMLKLVLMKCEGEESYDDDDDKETAKPTAVCTHGFSFSPSVLAMAFAGRPNE